MKNSRRALLLSIAAAACFSITFVLNRSMTQADGHWAWTSSLRFHLTLPLLAIVLTARSQWGALARAWRAAPGAWLAWGTVGFVVFYAPVTAASLFAPAWMIAGTWSLTVVMGILLSPLIYTDVRRYIPRRALGASLLIVSGVLLLQFEHVRTADWGSAASGLLLVLIGAIAYPLGNRRMMLALENLTPVGAAQRAPPIDTFVRVTAMTLGSLPAWIVISAYGYTQAGPPQPGQLVQAGIIALSSGLVATWLFFTATDSVRGDPVALAGAEAGQAAEVPCAVVLEMLLLGAPAPRPLGLLGLGVVVAGIIDYAKRMGEISEG